MTNQRLTSEQRRELEALAHTGISAMNVTERTIMSLVRRLLVGSADRLPNGEGGVVAITAAGCRAIDMDPADACKVGEPLPYWTERA